MVWTLSIIVDTSPFSVYQGNSQHGRTDGFIYKTSAWKTSAIYDGFQLWTTRGRFCREKLRKGFYSNRVVYLKQFLGFQRGISNYDIFHFQIQKNPKGIPGQQACSTCLHCPVREMRDINGQFDSICQIASFIFSSCTGKPNTCDCQIHAKMGLWLKHIEDSAQVSLREANSSGVRGMATLCAVHKNRQGDGHTHPQRNLAASAAGANGL